MSKDIWNKYIKMEKIKIGNHSKIYKAQNKETGNYVTIKEIDKDRIDGDKYLKEIEKINKINSENIVKLIEFFDTNEILYLIMNFYSFNLEDYIKIREKPFSINEIRELLIQLNKVFEQMLKENIIYRNLKLSNIMISFDSIDKCLIKLSIYGVNKFLKKINSFSTSIQSSTTAPEILQDRSITKKCDLWSLGTIIYYLLFKEYPYKGSNEIMLIKEITSGKTLKTCENEELNDLINKMLTFDVNERISWEEYFNHSFFKQKKKFNFICEIHSKIFQFYCKKCKKNICNDCLNIHNNHQIISFSKIGFTNEELNQVENINKEITNNLIHLNKIKNDISIILNQIKLIKENNSIYENDSSNNFKKYYIDNLKLLNDKIKIDENIELIELNLNEQELSNNNFIICEYDIKEDNINKEIQILNCFEQALKEKSYLSGIENEKELRENCELYLNDEKINFCFKYKFPREGKYKIKMAFKRYFTNINYMFYECSSLISLDLSNFLTNKVINMKFMFHKCKSLSNISLSNINTNNVYPMDYMFSECSSLTSLNLSNFNTNNVNDMRGMFYNSSSLTSLNLSNFNTNNVNNMSYMFYNCSSLTSLNLSNFNTNNVNNMDGMFSDCTSLTSLNLSNFNTRKVNRMNKMFYNCSSLISLNLSNFVIGDSVFIDEIFYDCCSLSFFNLYNAIIHDDINLNNLFSGINKKCNVITNDIKIKNFFNKKSIFSSKHGLGFGEGLVDEAADFHFDLRAHLLESDADLGIQFSTSFILSTIKEKRNEENSNCFFEYYKMFILKCKYCKKKFDGDIIEVDYPQNKNIKLYYCPKCFDEHIYSKIINKINFKKKSSNDIKFLELKKCSNEYKAKII